MAMKKPSEGQLGAAPATIAAAEHMNSEILKAPVLHVSPAPWVCRPSGPLPHWPPEFRLTSSSYHVCTQTPEYRTGQHSHYERQFISANGLLEKEQETAYHRRRLSILPSSRWGRVP
jgi:hypothetical protein